VRHLIPCLHDRANVEQIIQNTRANCSTSARCLLAFVQLARRAMVISMLIRRAGGLYYYWKAHIGLTRDQLRAKPRPTFEPGGGVPSSLLDVCSIV